MSAFDELLCFFSERERERERERQGEIEELEGTWEYTRGGGLPR